MRLIATGLLAAACALGSRPAPAKACSVTSTFLPPTNVELVAKTPRIVVATVKATVADGVELEVTRVIKGNGIAAGDTVRVSGSLLRYRGASTPGDFSRARPGAYAGSCTAWDYAVGKSYVVLLAEHRGAWNTVGTPFARVNEEAEPIWLRAVEEYGRIGAIADRKKRRAALQALIARGEKKKASAADRAIATDVERHFATPSPGKPFAELLPMYKKMAGRGKATVLLAIGASGDPAAAAFMKRALADVRAGKSPVDDRILFDAIGEYFAAVSDGDALADIAELYVSLGWKRKQDRWPLMNLLIDRAGDRHLDVMTRALSSADDEEAGRLGAWFVRHPSPAALDDLESRVEPDYAEKSDISLALAGMGDAEVIQWAKRMIAGRPADGRWIAIYAAARSPRADADALAGKIIVAGGEDLVTLIQGYGEATHPRATGRLQEILRKKLTAEQKQWLDRTLGERATRAAR